MHFFIVSSRKLPVSLLGHHSCPSTGGEAILLHVNRLLRHIGLAMTTALKFSSKHYFIIFIFYSFSLTAQKNIQSCDSLQAERQYLSAFECLQNIDPDNSDPETVLKKTNLALEYNVRSIQNHLFEFVDMPDDKDLNDFKNSTNQTGAYFFEFKIDTVLLKLIEKDSSDYRLVKALGDFYYNTFQTIGDNWFLPARTLLEKFNESYHLAWQNGIYDANSLYAMAFYYSVFEDYGNASYWYERSLELEPDDPLVAYGLAVNNLLNKQPEKGIEPMEHAYHLFKDSLKKGDAARILGIMYYQTNHKELALKMFLKADSLSPFYHPNQMFLLRSQLQMGQQEPAIALAKIIFAQAPVDPDVPDELLEMFRTEGEGKLLETLFRSLLKEYKHNPEANGNLRFHYGKLLFLEGNPRRSVRMFKKSRSQFRKVLPPGHHVFKMLNDMIERIES